MSREQSFEFVKDSSYRQWYNELKKYGQTGPLLSQKEYWCNAVKVGYSLPVEYSYDKKLKAADTNSFRVSLSALDTQRLLQDVSKAYNTEINDILLCALSITLGKCTRNREILIGLEGHGREYISDEVDINRTVGWFTSLYPVLLPFDSDKDEAVWIKEVKKRLHSVPEKGIGYGVLKYLNQEPALQGQDPWEIVFNYLGQLDNVVKRGSFFEGVAESSGANSSDNSIVSYKISINCLVRAGQLKVIWQYSNRHFTEQTIKRLADEYLANLRKLIDHCVERYKLGHLEDRAFEALPKSNAFKNSMRFERQKESQLLVPIRKGKNKVPLYIVCGGGGTVFKFKNMVDLLDDNQTVFGLQQPTEMQYVEKFPETIEEIAAKYISEVLLENPEGPYALAGHCSGGLVAYEMAKQLDEMGKKVKLLVMLDTVVPLNRHRAVPRKKTKIAYLKSLVKKSMSRILFKLDFELHLLKHHPKDSLYYKLRNLKAKFKNGFRLEEETTVFDVYKRLTMIIEKAAGSYEVKPSNRKVIVFYAKDHYIFYDESRNVTYGKHAYSDSVKNRWDKVAGSVEMFEVEGEHSTMFDPAIGGKELARLLQYQLDNCDS